MDIVHILHSFFCILCISCNFAYSASYYKRQAERRLLKKKPDNAATVPHDNCSLDLNPIPDTDRDLFGQKQSSEEESLESASDSEDSGSGSDTCSVTSEDRKAAIETLEHEEKEPETGEWLYTRATATTTFKTRTTNKSI